MSEDNSKLGSHRDSRAIWHRSHSLVRGDQLATQLFSLCSSPLQAAPPQVLARRLQVVPEYSQALPSCV